MLGVFIALGASLTWAGSSILLKYLSSKIDAISVNMMRLWVGMTALIALVFLTGRAGDILHTPLLPILLVVASGILSNAIGDTVYIQSLSYLDVSISYPISQSAFPLLTLIAAIFFLNESFTWFNILGAAFVIAGIFMIVRNNKKAAAAKNTVKGVVMTLIAALLWASGSITLKIGLEKVDTFTAAAIRVTMAALVLTTVAFSRKPEERPKLNTYGNPQPAVGGERGVVDLRHRGNRLRDGDEPHRGRQNNFAFSFRADIPAADVGVNFKRAAVTDSAGRGLRGRSRNMPGSDMMYI